MELDRHAVSSNKSILENPTGAGAMEILNQFISSSWTPEKSLVSAIVVAVVVIVSIYKVYISPILPIQVKCWFCDEVNVLPPGNRNQFDCRHCEQYNGFSPDGDYNKDIPAQRDSSINVFSAEASRNGADLNMYHNGLCELCNNRQTRKMQARNQFYPSNSKREAQEFEEYCRLLEKTYPLCPTCERHVSTRLSYQNAYLDPYVKQWMSSRWLSRIGRFMFSNHIIFVASFAPVASFYLVGWFQALPLALVFILQLACMAKSRLLFASSLLRAVTFFSAQLEYPLEAQHKNLLNIGSVICAFVSAFSAVQTIIGNLFSKKNRKSAYPFRNVEDLSKILSPLLSSTYLKLKQTQNWVHQKASCQIDTSLGALSLGKPPPARRSLGSSPTVISSNVPKSFVFGKSTVGTTSILRPSRLSQSLEDFTPPPSQDTSSSDYFISASRWCCGEQTQNGKGHEDPNWDARTTATQKTVHNVVFAPRETSQQGVWTVAVLLAALLLKLCWTDLIYFTKTVCSSLSDVLL